MINNSYLFWPFKSQTIAHAQDWIRVHHVAAGCEPDKPTQHPESPCINAISPLYKDGRGISCMRRWHNKGPIIAADGKIIVYQEKGDLWDWSHRAHPSIDMGVLYIRHGEMITACQIGR